MQLIPAFILGLLLAFGVGIQFEVLPFGASTIPAWLGWSSRTRTMWAFRGRPNTERT